MSDAIVESTATSSTAEPASAGVDFAPFVKAAQAAVEADAQESNEASGSAEPTPEEPKAPPKPKAPAAPTAADIEALRKRWKAGDHEGVLREIAGAEDDISKARLPGVFARIRNDRRELTKRASELEEKRQTIVRAFQPLKEAREAFDAGDVETAVQKAFGLSMTEFGKRHVSQLTSVKTVDPRVDALTKELETLRTERTREVEERKAEAAKASAAVAEASERAALVDTLGSMGEYAKVAQRPAFADRVIHELRAHWDARTESTVSISEAAAAAYEYLYGEPAAAPAPRVKTGRPRAALSRGESVSSAPAFAPGSTEMLAYYANLAKKAFNQ
jgi:DNA repair exonuclease SbcCD ATPase subunit